MDGLLFGAGGDWRCGEIEENQKDKAEEISFQLQ